MAITREKKAAISEKLRSILDGAATLVFVNFHKLTVGTETEIRRTLREKGVSYYVAKKTLLKRALADKKYAGTLPELNGEFAVVYGEDAVAPAREINEFVKKNGDSLSILGGVFENAYMGKEDMMSIATIPSLQVLHGQIVNLINSPIQGFVMALDQIAQKKETTA